MEKEEDHTRCLLSKKKRKKVNPYDVTTTIHDNTVASIDTDTDTETANTDIAATVVSTTNATDVTMDTEVYGSSIVLDQNGEYTLCKAINNKFTIRSSEYPSLFLGSSLPGHPNPSMVDTTVLPTHVAELVTVPLLLPPNPDPSKVYLIQASTTQDNASNFVSVIYYSSNTADSLTASDAGTHMRRIYDVRTTWLKHGLLKDGGGGGNVAHAAGLYLEMGIGCLPGKDRCTIQFTKADSKILSSNIPYVRQLK